MGNNEQGKLFQTNSSDENLEIKNVRSVTFNKGGEIVGTGKSSIGKKSDS